MKVMIGGFSPQSGTAIEAVARLTWPDVDFVHHGRGDWPGVAELSEDARECDLCVVDLLGLGLGTRNDVTEVRLELFLANRGAVLLVPTGDDGGWLALNEAPNQATPRRVIQRPVNVANLQSALRTASTSVKRRRPVGLTNVTVNGRDTHCRGPVVDHDNAANAVNGSTLAAFPARTLPEAPPATPHHISTSELGGPVASAVTGPAPVAKTPVASAAGLRLGSGGFDALCAASPEITKYKFVQRLVTLATAKKPSLVLITPGTGAVIHPRERWISSNIRTEIVRRLLLHDVMLQTVRDYPLSEDSVIEAAAKYYGRRADGRRTLDEFIWSIVARVNDESALSVADDFQIQLHTYPNFTRLPKTNERFMQLATVCLRGPQTAANLALLFPRVTRQQIALFMAAVVLCEMAAVVPNTASKAHTIAPPADPPKPSRLRGVFGALLDRLF